MSINKDQVEGRVKEAAGKVQQTAGKVMGSTKQQVQGAVNEAAGKAQATYGDVKSDVRCTRPTKKPISRLKKPIDSSAKGPRFPASRLS